MKIPFKALALSLLGLCLCACSNGEVSPGEGASSDPILSAQQSGESKDASNVDPLPSASSITMTPGEKVAAYLRENPDSSSYSRTDPDDPDVRFSANFSVSGETFSVSSYNSGTKYGTSLSWTLGNSTTIRAAGNIYVSSSSYPLTFKVSVSGDSLAYLGIEETLEEEDPRTDVRIQRAFSMLTESLSLARSMVLTPAGWYGW